MLVLLPGIQAGLVEFSRLRPLLGPHLALELPACAGRTLAEHAAALEAALPPGAHDFVAASFGGLLVWALPRGRVRRVVTLGTLPFATPAVRRSDRAAHVVAWTPERLYRALYERRIRASLIADGADPAVLAAVSPPPRAVLAGRLAAIGAWGLGAPPPGAVWAWGEADPWVTWTREAVAAVGAEPEVLPGGHRPHLSHPDAVAALVRRVFEPR